MHAPSLFKADSANTFTESERPLFQGRAVHVTKVNRDIVDSALEDALLIYARGEKAFPANMHIYEGRSLYAELSPEAAARYQIDGVKMKSGQGFVRLDSGEYRHAPPSPRERLSLFDEPHLTFDADATPRIVIAKPKGLNAMTLKQAEREFYAHDLLSRENLSLRPLLAGQFFVDGKPELDLNGQETGFVFLESSPAISTFGRLVGFSAYHGDDGFSSTQFSVTHAHGGTNFCELMKRHNSYLFGASGTKREALEKIGLTRHVAHLDNLLVHTKSGQILISDLDSVGMLSLDHQGSEAMQIIRDVSSDTLRTVCDLSRRTFSDAFLQLCEIPGPTNPFSPFLIGFFYEDVEKEKLARTVTSLGRAYVKFVAEHAALLFPFYKMRRDLFQAGQSTDRSDLSLNWKMIHNHFADQVLLAVSELYQQSALSKRYPFPIGLDVSPEALRPKFQKAVHLLTDAYNEQVDLASRRMQGQG